MRKINLLIIAGILIHISAFGQDQSCKIKRIHCKKYKGFSVHHNITKTQYKDPLKMIAEESPDLVWTNYYEDGKLIKRIFHEPKNVRNGRVEYYYENELVKKIEAFGLFFSSIDLEYDTIGQLISSKKYYGGELGEFYTFSHQNNTIEVSDILDPTNPKRTLTIDEHFLKNRYPYSFHLIYGDLFSINCCSRKNTTKKYEHQYDDCGNLVRFIDRFKDVDFIYKMTTYEIEYEN